MDKLSILTVLRQITAATSALILLALISVYGGKGVCFADSTPSGGSGSATTGSTPAASDATASSTVCTVSEVDDHVYQITIPGSGQMVTGCLPVDDTLQQINTSGSPFMLDMSPFFYGKTFSFTGKMTEFACYVVCSVDSNGKVVPDWDRRVIIAAKNLSGSPTASSSDTTLSSCGNIDVGDNAIVTGTNAKSGWVSIDTPVITVGSDPNDQHKVQLKGVNFWVNSGGTNWLSFAVSSASWDGTDEPVNTTLADDGNGHKVPTLTINNQSRLRFGLVSLFEPSLTQVPLPAK